MSSKFNYQRYLASREWALLKKKVRERSGGLCERGHVDPVKATAVHHLTYERIGQEWLEDLLHVCDACHTFLSGDTDFDPAGLNEIIQSNEEWQTLHRIASAELLQWYVRHFGPPNVGEHFWDALRIVAADRGHSADYLLRAAFDLIEYLQDSADAAEGVGGIDA